MEFKPCQPYHAVLADKAMLTMAAGKSAFKVYFISIIGRADPLRYEWPRAQAPKEQLLKNLQTMEIAGIGFITAFPHVLKIFRFAPAAETVLDVRAFKTADLTSLDLKRAEGYLEFACYAEALIAADEYALWAKAKTIPEYLEKFSAFKEGRIFSNTKLRNYFNNHER
jgi:hypothetical protein